MLHACEICKLVDVNMLYLVVPLNMSMYYVALCCVAHIGSMHLSSFEKAVVAIRDTYYGCSFPPNIPIR